MTQSAAAPRHDLYATIHKAIRLAEANLLVRIGTADFTRPSIVAAIARDVRAQIAFSISHLRHEDDHIHTALEARVPGGAHTVEHEHDEHEKSLAAIEALIARIEAAETAERPALGHQLYLRFARFVGEDFLHMNGEETVTMPLLQSRYSDEELIAIEHAILSSIPPQEMGESLRVMVPAINREERARLFGGMKQSAPAEVFIGVLEGIARPTLSPEDFSDLTRRLGIAA